MATPARLLNQLGSIAASGGGSAEGFESIATYNVTSAQSPVEFTNIPQGFKHLQLVAFARGNRTPVTYDGFNIRFNGDTGSNYSYHSFFADARAGGPFADSGAPLSAIPVANIPGSASLANVFGAAIIDILDYTSSKVKTVRSLNGYDANTTGWSNIFSNISSVGGAWYSTSAITSITLIAQNPPFQQYSHFALYGLKG